MSDNPSQPTVTEAVTQHHSLRVIAIQQAGYPIANRPVFAEVPAHEQRLLTLADEWVNAVACARQANRGLDVPGPNGEDGNSYWPNEVTRLTEDLEVAVVLGLRAREKAANES